MASVTVPPDMILSPSPDDTGTQMVLVSSLSKDSTLQIAESNSPFPAERTVTHAAATLMAEPDCTDLTYRTKDNIDNNTTLLDINQFMEVIYTYNCKFCNFSTKQADEMSSHVLSVHIEKPPQTSDQGTEPVDVTKCDLVKAELMDHVYNAALSHDKVQKVEIIEEGSAVGGDGMMEHGSLGLVADVQNEVLPTVQDSAANTDNTCQELFMCGQCTLAFLSIEQCRQHMQDEHNITLLPELDRQEQVNTEDISATVKDPSTDKVSTATQVMILKKPGRKRKRLQPDSSGEDKQSSMVNLEEDKQDKDTLDLNVEFKEEPVDDAAEMPIFNEEFLSEREREGKRRIRIPKSLQHDYYVAGSRDSRKLNPVSSPKYHLPAQLKKDLNESYNVKCKVAGCKARFQNENSLDEHMKCHNRTENGELGKGFKCLHCPFTSLQWSPVRLHLWVKHSINLDLLSCDKCEYCTDAIHKLEIHKQIHEDKRNYHCETCGKSFKQLTQLMHHSNIHKTNKGGTSAREASYQCHQCHICNRVMADSKSLKNHIQFVHEKVRCFSCKFCGHTSARKHMLQVHMRTHTGERPHKCDLCTFATSDHNTLRRHRLRHTGEKPYKCRYCSYACIQAISLKVHMKNKHLNCEGLYYCQLCHYHTVNEKNWLQHQEDHKNGLIEENVQKISSNSENSKKQRLISFEPKPVRELITNTGTNPNEIQLYEVKHCGADVEVLSNVTEVIQPSPAEANTDSPVDIQYVYYTLDDNTDKEELVIPKTFLAADGENVVTSAKPAFHTVQISQGGKDATLSFTLQPVTGGEQQLVVGPVLQERESLLGVKTDSLELVGPNLSTEKLPNE